MAGPDAGIDPPPADAGAPPSGGTGTGGSDGGSDAGTGGGGGGGDAGTGGGSGGSDAGTGTGGSDGGSDAGTGGGSGGGDAGTGGGGDDAGTGTGGSDGGSDAGGDTDTGGSDGGTDGGTDTGGSDGGTGGSDGGAGGSDGGVDAGTGGAPSPDQAPAPTPPTPPPGNTVWRTLKSWFIHLGQLCNRQVQGSVRQIVDGNSEEYVTGVKYCLVVGGVQDLYKSHKSESIYGVESKIVVGGLVELFQGAKTETAASIVFESNGGARNQLAPSGSKKKDALYKEKVEELKDIVAKLDCTCANHGLRAPCAKVKITQLKQVMTNLTETIKDCKASIDAVDGQYVNMKWQSKSGWTDNVSGLWKMEAGTFHAKTGGDAKLKAARAMIKTGSGAKITLVSGTATVNKHLKIS
jgi:hypothetical protein